MQPICTSRVDMIRFRSRHRAEACSDISPAGTDSCDHRGSAEMQFGVSMFHTDYSIPALQLARALEERGFDSMWAPEHSHIPVPRRTPFPGGVEVPKPYYEVMDPFVVLSAAAAVTKTLKLATGVCLV